MPPKYNVGDVVRLKPTDVHTYVSTSHIVDPSNFFITITRVIRVSVELYEYEGIYPIGGIRPTSIGTITVPQRAIADRSYMANGLHVGRSEHEVAATFHVVRLRRAQAAAAAGGGGGGGSVVMNFGPEFVYHPENNNNNAAAGGGGGGGAASPPPPVNNNNAYRAAFEASLVQAQAPTHYTLPTNDPEALGDPASINNNEDPKPPSRGGRRRKSRVSTRRVRRNKSRKH